MLDAYHEGEALAHKLAGVEALAARASGAIRRVVPDAAQSFLAQQPVVILGGEAGGRAHASLLVGAPGFARATSGTTLRFDAALRPDDPAAPAIREGARIGLLAIDPPTRRRMRANGAVARADRDGFELHVEQVYSNCPKYVTPRPFAERPAPRGPAERSPRIEPRHASILRRADTFYLATLHAERGADASHRGGLPGFVRVHEDGSLSWPDYAGNNMLQSIGNLLVDARAGLLVLDAETGGVLQVSGRASVDWSAQRAAEWPGALRVIDLAVDDVAWRAPD